MLIVIMPNVHHQLEYLELQMHHLETRVVDVAFIRKVGGNILMVLVLSTRYIQMGFPLLSTLSSPGPIFQTQSSFHITTIGNLVNAGHIDLLPPVHLVTQCNAR